MLDTEFIVQTLTDAHPSNRVNISIEYDKETDCLVLRTSHVLLNKNDLEGDWKTKLRAELMKTLEQLDLMDEYHKIEGTLWSPTL